MSRMLLPQSFGQYECYKVIFSSSAKSVFVNYYDSMSKICETSVEVSNPKI